MKVRWLAIECEMFCVFLVINSFTAELAAVAEDDQKAPFSIATTPRCRVGRYSFPWIASLYP